MKKNKKIVLPDLPELQRFEPEHMMKYSQKLGNERFKTNKIPEHLNKKPLLIEDMLPGKESSHDTNIKKT